MISELDFEEEEVTEKTGSRRTLQAGSCKRQVRTKCYCARVTARMAFLNKIKNRYISVSLLDKASYLYSFSRAAVIK